MTRRYVNYDDAETLERLRTKTIYLDNNATTAVAPEALEEMLPFLKHFYGNPSSMHSLGGYTAHKIDEARERVADLIGANPTEIIFTSGGTEGDNAAILSALETAPQKKHIITTKVEHPAVKNFCEFCEKRGYGVSWLFVDKSGMLNLDELEKTLRDDTAIVSVMWANNETGVVFPIEEISQIVKRRGVPFHIDAVQAAGKIPINVKKIPVDYLVISGHKIHAPKGVGALYARRGARFRPLIMGGHQERGRRAGTENAASIIGFGKACELAKKNIEIENKSVKNLRDRLEKTLLEKIPGAYINGEGAPRTPNTTSVAFEGAEGEAILLMLNEHGVSASSGSACTSGSLEPSHILRAMNVPFTRSHGSVRFSLSVYNTKEEIDKVIEVLPGIIRRLREVSPYGGELLSAKRARKKQA